MKSQWRMFVRITDNNNQYNDISHIFGRILELNFIYLDTKFAVANEKVLIMFAFLVSMPVIEFVETEKERLTFAFRGVNLNRDKLVTQNNHRAGEINWRRSNFSQPFQKKKKSTDDLWT